MFRIPIEFIEAIVDQAEQRDDEVLGRKQFSGHGAHRFRADVVEYTSIGEPQTAVKLAPLVIRLRPSVNFRTGAFHIG